MIHEQSEALQTAVDNVIAKYHTKRLENVVVSALFRDSGQGPGGGKTTVKIARGLTKFLAKIGLAADVDVFLEVEKGEYELRTDAQRIAMLDHHVTKIDVIDDAESGKRRIVLRKPEVREFSQVVARHGAWNPELRDFVKTTRQLKLFPGPAEESAGKRDRKSAATGA